jgi:hypothetical protein
MIGFLLRATVGTIALALLAYTVVAVPLGRRTLYEHSVQIFHTKPAQELAEDLRGAAADVVARVSAKPAESPPASAKPDSAAQAEESLATAQKTRKKR